MTIEAMRTPLATNLDESPVVIFLSYVFGPLRKKRPIITHIIVSVNSKVNLYGKNTMVGMEKRVSIRKRAAEVNAIKAFG